MQITFETRKPVGVYVLRQGVPEGRSGEGYTSFKPWPLHVEVIPGVSVVGVRVRGRRERVANETDRQTWERRRGRGYNDDYTKI